MSTTPQHHIIKETSETLSRLFQDEFKRNGYKRVHIVEQAPKPDQIEGKLPAVSVYLYQISIDPDGFDANVHNEIVEVEQADGSTKEFTRRRRLWVRLDYLFSAWAQTPEDEQLLLGLIIRTVMENPEMGPERLKGGSFEPDFLLNLQLAARLDEGTLSRFWGSLNQPVRPAVQAWSAIPILPERLEEFKRVQTRQLEYRSITDPRIRETGPSGSHIGRTLNLNAMRGKSDDKSIDSKATGGGTRGGDNT
jgi:hypothetical protein